MSKADRNKDRQLERDIAARAKTVVQTGLPASPSRIDYLALARTMDDLVKTPAALARRAQDVFELSAQLGAPLDKLACGKGCAYCCHGMVAITVPEAFLLAAHVRAGGEAAIAAFRDRAATMAGKTPAERLGAKLPCPLLGDGGACSVYSIRPIACRRVVAFDLKPCVEEFEGQDGDIDVPAHYNVHAAHVLVALALAFGSQARPFAHYEFASAVLAVLDAPDAEARWRRGENVFAHLRCEDVGRDVDRTAAAVRG